MVAGLRFLWEVRDKRFSDFDREYIKERMHALLLEWTILPLCLAILSAFLLSRFARSRGLEPPAWRDFVLSLFFFMLLVEAASYGILRRAILDSGALRRAARASGEPILPRFIALFAMFSTQPLTAQAFALVHYALFGSLLHFFLLCAVSVLLVFWVGTRLEGFYAIVDELSFAEIYGNQKDL